MNETLEQAAREISVPEFIAMLDGLDPETEIGYRFSVNFRHGELIITPSTARNDVDMRLVYLHSKEDSEITGTYQASDESGYTQHHVHFQRDIYDADYGIRCFKGREELDWEFKTEAEKGGQDE